MKFIVDKFLTVKKCLFLVPDLEDRLIVWMVEQAYAMTGWRMGWSVARKFNSAYY